MSLSLVTGVVLLLSVIGFWLGRRRATAQVGGRVRELHSVPGYYGAYVALWAGLPALVLMLVWAMLNDWLIHQMVMNRMVDQVVGLSTSEINLMYANIVNLANGTLPSDGVDPALLAGAEHLNALQSGSAWALGGLMLVVALSALAWSLGRVLPQLRARNAVEKLISFALLLSSIIAVLTTVGIVLSLIFESLQFFAKVPVTDFLFGLHWSPQTALRADQAGSSGSFGAIPLFVGTLLIMTIAMVIALPIGLMAAIFLAEYAGHRVRSWVKPALEILAGIPTVVYGFFAALTVAPFLRDAGSSVGLHIASESALAAGLVMGVMIVPFVSSLSDDVINAVPQSLRDGSYGMGATKSETIVQVVLPAALPGIVGAFLLAISRAIGETMIVVMAAGLAANLTFNPLEAVTTVTVQIATLLVGDQEFDSPKTLSVFALGLTLFLVTLMLNVVALRIVQKYREKYD
jgi:phosphate transport system permease protein